MNAHFVILSEAKNLSVIARRNDEAIYLQILRFAQNDKEKFEIDAVSILFTVVSFSLWRFFALFGIAVLNNIRVINIFLTFVKLILRICERIVSLL